VNVEQNILKATVFFEKSSTFMSMIYQLPSMEEISESNLITVQEDATYSDCYISVGISTGFGC